MLRNHRDFAIDNLRIAIDYLSAKDKSTQLNLYFSSILNTDNKEIIEKFADQLSSRYREIKNLQNAQLVLCYSAKELISNVKPEVDFSVIIICYHKNRIPHGKMCTGVLT
ncbi:hypothetical protein [Serratia symbiotica]|uniref:hypothetical protein n=1 Tax=Serratia symbiotica TaxID=138074 RepID=UPI001B35F63F|nr:hypothetical protein [Serratia symbiotica]MBQ0956636.1 hypothetical protein [Serratia symbiotica]